MGPIAKTTQEKFADKSIQFVTFDFTSDETKAAAEAEAAKLGVAELYGENAPKTGFALLYDTTNKKVITKLSAKQNADEWAAVIEKAFSEG